MGAFGERRGLGTGIAPEAGEEGVVEAEVVVDHLGERKIPFEDVAAAFAGGARPFGGDEAILHGPGHGAGIAVRDQPARFAVGDQFGEAARSGGEHGAEPGHGFHDALGLVFDARGLDEDVDGAEKAVGVGPSEPFDAVLDVQAAGQPPEGGQEGAIAGDADGPGARGGVEFLGEHGGGAEEKRMVFLLAETSERAENERGVRLGPKGLGNGPFDPFAGIETGRDSGELQGVEAAPP